MITLEKIVDKTFYEMEKYHQITIDYVEKVEILFSEIDESDDEKSMEENLLALSYQISCILEIFNPQHIMDIEVFNNLLVLILRKITELK